MREALLYDRLNGGNVRCRLCPWDCQPLPGEKGRCLVRENRAGVLYTLNYGLISAAAIEPIERRGLYHLFPGSRILSLGGLGNNLRCRHRPAPAELPGSDKARVLDAERAVSFALERRCRGVAWGFQEPTVWMEYVLDLAKLVRANGMFTLMITNGYITKEALDLLGPYLDAYAVEIPAVSPGPYEALCGTPQTAAVLEGAVYVQRQWRGHVEVHTVLVPGVNDSPDIVRELALWLMESLGPDTPWHLWPFVPAGELAERPPTPRDVLEGSLTIGRQAGLRYVYIQTGEADGLTSTACPSCGNLLVRREGQYNVKVVGLEGGKCAQCGQEIPMRRSIFK